MAGTVVLLAVVAEVSEAAIFQRQAKDGSLLSVEGPDGREYTVEEIGARCVEFEAVKAGRGPFDYRECRVTESGEFGDVEGRRYRYATYCLMPADAGKGSVCCDGSFDALNNSHRAQAIFAVNSQDGRGSVLFRLTGASSGAVRFGRRPFIAKPGANTLMVLPVAQDGTANLNRGIYFILRRGTLDRIDGKNWEEDLLKRLPAGAEIRKGIWPDLRSPVTEIHLWRREEDVDCCPTWGVARVRLRVAATRLEMVGVEFEPAR